MSNSPPFDPARLDHNDPPPFTQLNPEGGSRFLITCDHASRAVPGHMKGLGLAAGDLSRHIAWDIGAAMVTRHLAERLDSPAFLAGYSRLIIDCNRPLTSPTSIPPVSDGSQIPANFIMRFNDLFETGRSGHNQVIWKNNSKAIVTNYFSRTPNGMTQPKRRFLMNEFYLR